MLYFIYGFIPKHLCFLWFALSKFKMVKNMKLKEKDEGTAKLRKGGINV